MNLVLPRLRAHATAMLLAASAALAGAGATGAASAHHAVLVPLSACAMALVGAVITWCWGEPFAELTLAGLVATVTVLVTLTAAVSNTGTTGDVLLFLLPVVFAACFLPIPLALGSLVACSGACAWLFSRHLSGASAIAWWTSATLVLASAMATVAVLRRELSATMLELSGLARRDPLTGLLNRRSFDQALANELERCVRSGGTCSLLMCDLDHFKAINDLHGHATGDAVLERVAGDLVAGVRSIDTVARVGGEELALLLVDCPRGTAKRVAERLRRQVAREPLDAPAVTISIGIADSSLTMGAEALLAHADRALYAAKRGGRNRVCCAAAPPQRPLELAA
ncbi:MAG: GGDEF domain-containing protein [Solirubrobacteraceae bacterium]